MKPVTAVFMGALVIALAVVGYLYYQRTATTSQSGRQKSNSSPKWRTLAMPTRMNTWPDSFPTYLSKLCTG